jgi:hypothetical protein
MSEASGFDCSVDSSFTLRLPASELLNGLGLKWNAVGADFVDGMGRVVAQDPTVHTNGPNALLMRQDALCDYLVRGGLNVVWSVLGEKSVLPPGLGDGPHYPRLKMSGAYSLVGGVAKGFLKCTVEEPPATTDGPWTEKVIGVLRSDERR